MKNGCFLLVIVFLLSSCNFFETEKISSETFIKEEINAINWKDVDTYPVFENCNDLSEKLSIKSCFEKTLTNELYRLINKNSTIVKRDLNEKIIIDFFVDEKSRLTITEIKMDSLLQAELPLLENTILSSIDSIQPIAPAYKRGIPVRTSFKLPITISSE